MNILVPTDFSHDAYNALFYATQLYKHQKCTFHILHVYDRQSHFKEEYRGNRHDKGLQQFLNDRATECLQETYHKIITDTDKNPRHNFLTFPKNGYLIKATKDYIATNRIDLLVMGNKGRTGAKEIFLGGNTIQMVKSQISCPVLCIPREIDFKTISQVAYITDYKHTLTNRTFDTLRSLALTYEASLHILHISVDGRINSSQEKNKELLSEYFDDVCLRFHTSARQKSKAMTVAHFVKEHKIDLLAIVYYRHYLLDKLFREPVVLDLSFYVEIPLLILPDQD
ncbi:MAG: universal stress protein [Aurantibacter sp.]